MASLAQLHPWSNLLQLSPVRSLFFKIVIPGQFKQFYGSKFQIIHVIVLLIEIGRNHAGCLCHTKVGQSKPVSFFRFDGQTLA